MDVGLPVTNAAHPVVDHEVFDECSGNVVLDESARLASNGLRWRSWRGIRLESAHLTRAGIAAHFVDTKQIVFVSLMLLQSNAVLYLILLMLRDGMRRGYTDAKPQAVGGLRFGRQGRLDEAKIDGAEAKIVQDRMSINDKSN